MGTLLASANGVVGDMYALPNISSLFRGGENIGENELVGGDDEKDAVLRGLLLVEYRKEEGRCCCCDCIAAARGEPV